MPSYPPQDGHGHRGPCHGGQPETASGPDCFLCHHINAALVAYRTQSLLSSEATQGSVNHEGQSGEEAPFTDPAGPEAPVAASATRCEFLTSSMFWLA